MCPPMRVHWRHLAIMIELVLPSGPIRVLNPNGISIGSAVFAGLTSVTDRQTTLLGR